MAKKKITSELKSEGANIFTIIGYLTFDKKTWDELTIPEQKLFNLYMIMRFLSMEPELIDTLNIIQKYGIHNPEPKYAYTLLYYLLPQSRLYLKYITSKNDVPEKDLKILIKYFQLSKRECEDYYQILNQTDSGKLVLENLRINYQYEKF